MVNDDHPAIARAATDTATHPRAGRARGVVGSWQLWVIIGLLFLFMMLNFADKSAIGLAGGPIRRDLGIGAAEFGLLGSAFFWLFPVGAVVLSLCFRKLGFRWSGVMLMGGWIISMLPLTMETTFAVVLACRVLLGFFEGPAKAFADSVTAEHFPAKDRAFVGSLWNAGSSAGPLLAAPVLTWIILAQSWHAVFLVLSVVSVVWLALWLLLYWPKRATGSETAEDDAALREATAREEVDAVRRGAVSLRFLFRLRTTWAVVLLTFSGYLILSLKLSWLPSFLEEGLGYPPESVGTLVTLPYAIAIAAALISGYLSNVLVRRGHLGRTSRGAVSTAFLVLGGASMVGFCLVPPGPVQFVLVILAFSMNPVPFTVAVAGASDFVPKRHRPAFFGWIVALYSVAGIVAPYVLGLIVDAAADVADGYSNGFIVVGSLICVLAVVGGLVLMNPEKGMADIDAEAGRLEQLSKA